MCLCDATTYAYPLYILILPYDSYMLEICLVDHMQWLEIL